MKRIAIINAADQIAHVYLADDDYAPAENEMLESEARELNLPRAPARLRDAKMWQIQVWLSRMAINPAGIPSFIEAATEDGPQRWEALARWTAVTDVPFDHSMVPLIWALLAETINTNRSNNLPEPLPPVTLESAWQEILKI